VNINILKSRELERWIKDSKSSIEELAQRPLIRQYASVMAASHDMSNPSYRSAHRSIVENHLKPRLKYGVFTELFVMCSREGHISASTEERQEGKLRNTRRYFMEGKSRTYLEGSYYSPALERPAMTVSTPVKDTDGHLVVVLAGRLDLGELSEIMGQQSGKSRTSDTYLVNSFNFFVSEPRFGKDYILKKAVRTEGTEAGLSGKDGFSFYNNYRGVPVIGAYKWLPELRMCIITEIEQSEAFAPVKQLLFVIVISIVAVCIAVVFLGMFFARTISRPLMRLADGAQKIGAGNLEIKVGTVSEDEIGDLSRAFDKMTQELKKTTVSRDELSRERDFSDSVMNSLPGVFYLFDEQGHFLRWNKNFEMVTEYSPEEISKMSPLALFSGEDKELLASRIKDVFIKGEETAEAYFVTKSGKKIPYYFTGIRIIIDGKPLLAGVGIDITSRKLSEDALLSLSTRQEAFLSAIPDIIMEVDSNKVYTWANQPGIEFFGEDVIGKEAAFYFEGEQETYGQVKPLFNGNENVIYVESLQRRKDGEKRLLAWWCRVLKDANGNVTGALSTARDISALKKAEEEVARTAQEWQSTFDSTNNAIWILDQDHRVLRSNKTAERFFHRPCGELIGKHCWEIVHGTAQPIPECPILRARKSLCREIMELQIGDVWFEVTVDPILDAVGRYAGAVHAVSDITERKRTEERLKEQFEELRRWNEAVMGREMRNLDLKREVNELLAKAGLPARYGSAE
jgi:PAS domain S-box-containing protein